MPRRRRSEVLEKRRRHRIDMWFSIIPRDFLHFGPHFYLFIHIAVNLKLSADRACYKVELI